MTYFTDDHHASAYYDLVTSPSYCVAGGDPQNPNPAHGSHSHAAVPLATLISSSWAICFLGASICQLQRVFDYRCRR